MSPLPTPPLPQTSPVSHAPRPSPSNWVLRWRRAWDCPGLTALDVGCGSGRHVRLLAEAGLRVTGVDRDAAALGTLADLQRQAGAELIEADIEAGPWPLDGRQFDLVLVTNYLWRPLLDRIKAAVAPGGWLIYETFTDGQQTVGRPSRPDFLLRPGELLAVCADLRVVGFEDGFIEDAPGGPSPVNGRYVQRVAAVRETSAMTTAHPRYPLKRG